jgi:hypothetical protein
MNLKIRILREVGFVLNREVMAISGHALLSHLRGIKYLKTKRNAAGSARPTPNILGAGANYGAS